MAWPLWQGAFNERAARALRSDFFNVFPGTPTRYLQSLPGCKAGAEQTNAQLTDAAEPHSVKRRIWGSVAFSPWVQ